MNIPEYKKEEFISKVNHSINDQDKALGLIYSWVKNGTIDLEFFKTLVQIVIDEYLDPI